MSREEAIIEIQNMRKFNYTLAPEEVFDMAINALNREQQFLDAGYKNTSVEFYIGGRKFSVREIPQ